MVSKVFSYGGDLHLVCVSSRMPLVLGFPLLDSRVILKQAVETLDQGPLLYPSAMGFNECWTSSISAQRIRFVRPITTGPSGYILSSSASMIKTSKISPLICSPLVEREATTTMHGQIGCKVLSDDEILRLERVWVSWWCVVEKKAKLMSSGHGATMERENLRSERFCP